MTATSAQVTGTPKTLSAVRPLTCDDWEAVRRIYEAGIATGNATFETTVPSWEEWDRSHLQTARLVAVLDNVVQGWIALSPVSSRCVYRGVAEVSVYVAPERRGRGIGRTLLRHAIIESEEGGIWTLQAGVFPENVPSLRLLESAGFRSVGRRIRLGCMGGVWRDVLLLERRSDRAGPALP